jgi:Flp pilus assembly protein protease CpaA
MWSDNEERLYQQDRHRRRIANRLLLGGLACFVLAVVLHHHTAILLVGTLVFMAALVTSAVLQVRWGIGGSTADTRAMRQERRADKAHREARRSEAIRNGTWTLPVEERQG